MQSRVPLHTFQGLATLYIYTEERGGARPVHPCEQHDEERDDRDERRQEGRVVRMRHCDGRPKFFNFAPRGQHHQERCLPSPSKRKTEPASRSAPTQPMRRRAASRGHRTPASRHGACWSAAPSTRRALAARCRPGSWTAARLPGELLRPGLWGQRRREPGEGQHAALAANGLVWA